jgi:uncharacterized protein (DUF2461 family)
MIGAPEAWRAIVQEVEGAGLTLGHGPAGTLKRMPRGFEAHADSPLAPALKLKGLVVTREVAPEATRSPAFTDEVVAFARDAMPLLAWGWDVADAAPAA